VKGFIAAGKLPGTWYLRIELPRAADGTRQRRFETVRATKKDAEKRLRELLREVETGHAAIERLTIAEVAKRWVASAEHRVGHRTFERYTQLVNDFIVPAVGSLRVDAVRPAHVDAAVTVWRKHVSVATGRPLTDRSIRHTYDTLRAICRWAVRMRLLPTNPCDAVTPPRWDASEMRPLDNAGLAVLLAAARGTELEAPIIVFVGTGLRRGEALGLRWNDIDLEGGQLSVRRSIEIVGGQRREKPPKTRRSLRTISMPAFVVNALRTHKNAQNERRLLLGLGKDENCFVFDRALDGSPWRPDQLSWRFADLVRRTKDAPKIRLHDLRHSYATFMLSAGVDLKTISTALGHSTIAVTANTYAHVTAALHEESASRLDVAIGSVVSSAAASAGQLRANPTRQTIKKPRGYRVSLVAPTGFEPVLPP